MHWRRTKIYITKKMCQPHASFTANSEVSTVLRLCIAKIKRLIPIVNSTWTTTIGRLWFKEIEVEKVPTIRRF